MRKFFAVFLSLLLLAGAVWVNAYASGEEPDPADETTYLSFGEREGLELVYIPAEHGTESVTYVVGNYCFTADDNFDNFGVLNSGEFTPLSDAYGEMGDAALSDFVEMFNSGKTGTELETWTVTELTDNAEIDVSGLDGTEPVPSETESDTVGETEPDETHTETCTNLSPYEPTGTQTESYSPYEPTETQTESQWVTPTQPFTLRPTDPTEPMETHTQKPIHNETDPAATEKPTIQPSSTKDDIGFSPKLNIKSATVKCGRVIKLKVVNNGGKKVTFTSAKPSVAKVGKTSGKVCAMRKGSTYIVAKVGSKKLKFTVRVITSPKLSKTSVKVRKGKTVKVKTVGKCPLIKNKYGKSKCIKVLSKTTSDTLKIKGVKKGKTTLKLKVNGYLLKLKVKVV